MIVKSKISFDKLEKLFELKPALLQGKKPHLFKTSTPQEFVDYSFNAK
jgi:hypothetical protein